MIRNGYPKSLLDANRKRQVKHRKDKATTASTSTFRIPFVSTLFWLSIPSHTSRAVKLYRGSRAVGTNFHFLSVFVVSEKKFMVQGEDKLKGSAQANLERNRQRFEGKNRPVPIWRRAFANWRRALGRKSSYFDTIAQLSVP